MAHETRQFKPWVRKNWNGWVESYEPRRGTGTGIPDLQIACYAKLVPIELKVSDRGIGKDYGKILFVKEIRAAQIAWHMRAGEAGIFTMLLIGDYDFADKLEAVYAIAGEKIDRRWHQGFERGREATPIAHGSAEGFTRALQAFIRSHIRFLSVA